MRCLICAVSETCGVWGMRCLICARGMSCHVMSSGVWYVHEACHVTYVPFVIHIYHIPYMSSYIWMVYNTCLVSAYDRCVTSCISTIYDTCLVTCGGVYNTSLLLHTRPVWYHRKVWVYKTCLVSAETYGHDVCVTVQDMSSICRHIYVFYLQTYLCLLSAYISMSSICIHIYVFYLHTYLCLLSAYISIIHKTCMVCLSNLYDTPYTR